MSNKNARLGVVPGVEVFLEQHLDLVKNRKVGLLTNAAGVDRQQNSVLELFYENPKIELKALFGPEHGLRANAQAGEYVPFSQDEKHNLPVFSLYGQDLKFDSYSGKDLDKTMRVFDTQDQGKIPKKAMLKELEVMIFDLQDVGTRIYTFAATMAYCMKVCAKTGIEFIILDRPNPLNGLDMEGPILEYPKFSSFVGLYPIPIRHAMTLGELALYFHENFLKKKPLLKVISMEGWKRHMWFDETSLPWIPPSPNMPNFKTAMVYPGQILFEGTNVSEGRGTTRPFEVFGAPWIDGDLLKKRLHELDLPGVEFQKSEFTPTFSKYQSEFCSGCHIYVTDRNIYKPLFTTLHIISVILDLYPKKFFFHEDYFDKVMGTHKVREDIEQGRQAADIIHAFDDEIREFAERRQPYLLYS